MGTHLDDVAGLGVDLTSLRDQLAVTLGKTVSHIAFVSSTTGLSFLSSFFFHFFCFLLFCLLVLINY